MSLVYRIQSKQDRTQGAYWMHPFITLNGHPRPEPSTDIGIERVPRPNEYCGFASAKALIQWFRGSILELIHEDGCEIVALDDVTITAIGEFQVLFTFNA